MVETSPANALINAKREKQRRDMLWILKGDYGQFVAVSLLGAVLKRLNHALSDRTIRFHLTYLEEKGFVELRRVDIPETRESAVIASARLRAAGLDFLDGRPGVGVAEY